VFREVEGLPKGTVKAVIDAYGELVDEGCLAIFGPAITDNCIPVREAIEERFRVPAISVTGSEEWLGEWTFSLSMGSMTDEPAFWAYLLAKAGHTEVGALVEQSLVGQSYIESFREACREEGIRIVAEAAIAQTAQDVGGAVRRLLPWPTIAGSCRSTGSASPSMPRPDSASSCPTTPATRACSRT
jgi:branched-chain amino acid transport system substrate-binding protein